MVPQILQIDYKVQYCISDLYRRSLHVRLAFVAQIPEHGPKRFWSLTVTSILEAFPSADSLLIWMAELLFSDWIQCQVCFSILSDLITWWKGQGLCSDNLILIAVLGPLSRERFFFLTLICIRQIFARHFEGMSSLSQPTVATFHSFVEWFWTFLSLVVEKPLNFSYFCTSEFIYTFGGSFEFYAQNSSSVSARTSFPPFFSMRVQIFARIN